MASLDSRGKQLRPGDRVRLVRRPPMGKRDPADTRAIFWRAVGRTFVVESLSEYGLAELDLRKIRKWDTVWVEPCLLLLVRRRRVLPSRRRQVRQAAA